MLKRLFRLTVWCLRLYYPVLRLLGRITGNEVEVETIIEVSESNIADTLDALGIETEGDE